MRITAVLRALGPVDARRVWRDSLLGWMMAVPLATAVLMRFGVPALAAWLRGAHGFDLVPYYPVIGGYFIVVMVPVLLGYVIGFLLLDERDDATLQALAVTPLSPLGYLAYRALVPTVLSFALMMVSVPLAGLAQLDAGAVAILALSAAPLAPLFAFFLPAFARNKVQGFALAKFAGAAQMLPLLAFFIDGSWRGLFGIIPSFWSLETSWALTWERSPWLALLVAVGYPALLLIPLGRRFTASISDGA